MNHQAKEIKLETDPKKIRKFDDEYFEVLGDRESRETLRTDGFGIVLAMKELAKSFRSRKTHNCPVCGGLVPELWIVLGERKYLFTCYEIQSTKTGKVLKQTDYGKLGHYATGTEETT